MYYKKLELKGHSGAVYTIDYDNEYLYSGSGDKFVTRWDLTLGTQDKFAIQFPFSVYSIRLFNTKQFLAVGLSNGDLHFFDLKERKELKFLQQHKKGIFCICENEYKNHLYVADADGNLSVWDTITFDLLIYLPLDCGKIRNICLDNAGTYFFIVGQDGYVRKFEANTFNEVWTLDAHKNGATSISVCENTIITGGKDALLKEWDFSTSSTLIEIPAHNYVIYDMLAHTATSLITASRDKSIKVWSTSGTLKFIEKLDAKAGGHRHSVNQLVAIDEDSFASCSDDKRIIVWSKL